MKEYLVWRVFIGVALCFIWNFKSIVAPLMEPVYNNKTVKVGVFVDKDDENAASINRTIELAMKVSNNTKYVRMFPIIKETDIEDSYKLKQTLCCHLAAGQTLALLGTSKSETFNVLKAFSRTLQLPVFLLTPSRELSSENDNFVINMCPSFIDPVIDFIKYMRWTRIFYLFDSDDGLWRLQKLYQAFNNPGRREDERLIIDAVWIPDVKNCREILRRLDRNYNFENKRIVVDLNSLKEYDIFMQQIIDVGMNRDGYHYLLGTLDICGMKTETWKSFKYGGVNITGFQLIDRETVSHAYSHVREILGENPPTEVALTVDAVAVLTTAIVKILQRSDSQDILNFRRGNLYLQMDCSSDPVKPLENGKLILEHIRNVTFDKANTLTGIISFDEYGNRKDLSLGVYHLSYRSPLQKAGDWQHKKGNNELTMLNMSRPRTPSPQTPNRTRIVLVIENDPFIQNKTKDNGTPLVGNDRYEGFCIDMLEKIASMVNFTYSIVRSKDSLYGARNETTNKWDGIIGELCEGRVDIGLASLTITRRREEVVRFTKPFMNTGISIMIRKPEKDKPGVFSFMEPLSYLVWACIMGGFIAVSFVLYMIGRFSPYEWQEEGIETAPSDTFSFINTLWFSLGALMQQGPDIFPSLVIKCCKFGRIIPRPVVLLLLFVFGRILGSAWWFFTLIMISSYTANLAAFLTFEKLTTPINSADDLVKQNKIKYGMSKSGSTFAFFKTQKIRHTDADNLVVLKVEPVQTNPYVSTEVQPDEYNQKDSKVPTYETMYKVMQSNAETVYMTNEKMGFERVYKEKDYAFLLESSINMYYSQRKPCKTMKVGRNLDQKGYGIATQKNKEREFGEKLNIAVLELRERGDLLKLEQKWWYSKGECGSGDSGEKGKSALNLSNVSGIFHILIGGLVLAMIISLSQIVFHAKMKPKRQKETYTVSRPPRDAIYKAPKKVTIEEQPPSITYTSSNGGVMEPHLISFEDHSEDGIISLDKEGT